VPRANSVPTPGHVALIILSEGKEGRSPQLGKWETRRIDEQIQASPRPEMTKQENESLARQGY